MGFLIKYQICILGLIGWLFSELCIYIMKKSDRETIKYKIAYRLPFIYLIIYIIYVMFLSI